MFTGIVEELGKIIHISENQNQKTFSISKPESFSDLHIGDSISINGVCLTIVEFTDTHFKVDAVGVTLAITTLGQLKINDFVNLERALLATSRLGGHYVQGHVDTTAKIIQIEKSDAFWKVHFQINSKWGNYLMPKAFIAIDGMSLTIVDVDLHQNQWSVMLIPHTRSVTNTQFYQINQNVNIEIDILAKYAKQFLTRG